MVAFSVGEEELRGVDTKPLLGHLAAWNYFMSVGNPQNKAFIDKYPRVGEEERRAQRRHRGDQRPMEATYVGLYMWEAGGREGRQHRRRQGHRGDGRAELQGAVGLHADHGRDQPPPAQAGADRRGARGRPVRRGMADEGPIRAQPWSPFIEGNEGKQGL